MTPAPSRSRPANAERIAADTVVFLAEERRCCYKERSWNMQISAYWTLSHAMGA
jgi:hypothetical protein